MSTRTAIIKTKNGGFYLKGHKERHLTKAAAINAAELRGYSYYKNGETDSGLHWISPFRSKS